MNKRTPSRNATHSGNGIEGAPSASKIQVDNTGDIENSAFHALRLRGRPIGIDDQGRVRLNDIHKAGGFSKHHTPSDWAALPMSQKLIVKVCEKTTGKSGGFTKSEVLSVYCSRVGRHGIVWANPNLALAYAKYLSADLHYEVNDLFLRARSGDAILADEILERASPEANAWAGARATGRAERRGYTDTLQRHGVRDHGYGICTNAIYRGLYGTDANGLRSQKGATKALRDAFDAKELAFTAAAEHLASERIVEEARHGNFDCQEASGLSAENLRKAIEADRASRRKRAA